VTLRCLHPTAHRRGQCRPTVQRDDGSSCRRRSDRPDRCRPRPVRLRPW
jgi:hypothetical protein